MAKKFKPPTSGRFKPPGDCTGRLNATTMTGRATPKAKPQREEILAKVEHLAGSETLIRKGSNFLIELVGYPSFTSRGVLGLDPQMSVKRRKQLTRSEAEDWGRAHCVWALDYVQNIL